MNFNIRTYILLLSVFFTVACNNLRLPEEWNESEKFPNIFPDYTELTIPANIAPLNFRILEPAEKFVVKIQSANGKPLIISGKDPSIQIDVSKWKKLLK